MDLLMRRRALMSGKSIDYIELPDYVRIDFSTTSENKQLKISYGGCITSDVILDGNNVEVVTSAGFYTITVPSTGTHTLYCKIKSTTASNSGFTYIIDDSSITYMRLPYNITEVCPNVSFRYKRGNPYNQIDILDHRRWTPFSNEIISHISTINVPVGTKSLYEEAGLSQSALNKINEVDFKYKIQ